MEASNADGAPGYSPSRAWLPMTTISRSAAAAPAARMTCSSSERVIHAATFGLREQGAEGRRLSQARRVFAKLTRLCRHFLPRAFEQLLPLAQRGRRLLAIALKPTLQGRTRPSEEARLGGDAARREHVQRQASRLRHPLVRPA